jgi:hypothetical protein
MPNWDDGDPCVVNDPLLRSGVEHDCPNGCGGRLVNDSSRPAEVENRQWHSHERCITALRAKISTTRESIAKDLEEQADDMVDGDYTGQLMRRIASQIREKHGN